MNAFLIFHTLAELFSILIAFCILTIAWNSRGYIKNSFFLFIGTAYASVASIDLIHTLAYKGMAFFTGNASNTATELWIAGRYVNAISLLIAPLFLSRKVRFSRIGIPYLVITLALLAFIFKGWFPNCYIEGSGLTGFKIISEYLVCILIGIAIWLLLRHKDSFEKSMLRLIILSMAFSIATELAFTLYTGVYSFFSVLGHIFKIIAFALLYKAIIVTGLRKPYESLFYSLNKSEQKFRSLFEFSPDAVFLSDTNGTITSANPAACAMLGWTEQELCQLNRDDILDTTDPRLNEAKNDRQKNGIIHRVELTAICKDGRKIPVEIDSVIVSYEKDRAFVFMRDITERKTSEAAILENREMLGLFIKHAPASLAMFDRNMCYINCSNKWLSDYRLEGRDLTGLSVYEIFPNMPEHWREYHKRGLDGETIRMDEDIFVREDGTSQWIRWEIIPWRDAYGKIGGIVIFTEDISMIKEAKEKIQHTVRDLNVANESLVQSRAAALNMMQDAIEAREAVEKANKALEWNAQRDELLSKIASELLKSDKPQKIVEDICIDIMKFLDCQIFLNFLIDDKTGKVHLNASAGLLKSEIQKMDWLDYGIAICGCIAQDCERIVAENIKDLSDPRMDLLKSYGIHAYCCHPLMYMDKCIGIVSFGTNTKTTFSPQELDVMKTITDMVTIAMNRIRTETALRESRAKLEAALESMTDAVLISDADGNFIEFNDAFVTFHKFNNKSECGRSFREYSDILEIYTEDETKIKFNKWSVPRALNGERASNAEYKLKRKDTGETWFGSYSYSPIYNDNGEVIGSVVVARDVTHIKHAQQQIESLAKFPEENPFPVLRIKNDCTILYSNAPGSVLLNEWKRKIGQKVPDNWVNFILNSVQYNRQLTEQIKCGENIFSIAITPVPDMEYVNLYGRDITIQEQIKEELRTARDELDVKVHQRTTELAQTVAILQKEIKDRVSAQTQLRERTKALDAFFAYTITPFVILDKEFNFIRVNKAYALGCQREIDEFAGHNHFEFYPHEENEKIFKQVVNTKEPYQAIAKPFSFPDHPELGVTYWDWTLVPILDKDKNVEFLVFSLLDVTKRKQAELALIESEQKYRSLVEFSPEAVCVLTDEKISFANSMAIKLTKAKSEQDIIGKSIWDIIHPEDADRARYELKELLQKRNKATPRDAKIICLDGSVVEIEVSATFILHNGKISVLVIFHDITERKLIEERRKTTNSLLELFISTSTQKEYLGKLVDIIRKCSNCSCVGIRLIDDENFIPYEANIGFSDDFLSLENQVCLDIDSCLCTRAISQTPELQERSFITAKGSFSCNNTIEFLDTLNEKEKNKYRGNCIKFGYNSLAIIPIYYRKDIIGAIHLADPKTDKVPLETVEFLEVIAMMVGEAIHRFSLEESLRTNEERLLEAQRIAHLGNWEWDILTNKIWWSDEVFRIFGLEPQNSSLTYEKFLSFIHPDDRNKVDNAVAQALDKEAEYNIDYRVINPDGEVRIIQAKGEVTYGQNNKPIKIAGTLYDITEQKQKEQEISENQKQLRALTAQLQIAEEQERRRIAQDLHDSIGQILSFSARELNNIQKHIPEKPAESIREIADQLNLAVQQARTLSFDLSPSILYDLGFEVAVEDLVDRFSRDRNIRCTFQNCPNPKPLTDEVKVLLYRSIRELLINASKYSNANIVKVSLLRSNSDICIKVEDDGEGFDVSILNEYSTKQKGFGIISIRERLNHIGGKLDIESTKGTGTRATLVAPLGMGHEKQ